MKEVDAGHPGWGYAAPMTHPAVDHLRQLVDAVFEGGLVEPMPRLLLLRHTAPTALEATVYEPMTCLILQGTKEIVIGETRLGFGRGEALLVSHDLPVVSEVVEASPDSPYLALVLRLDLGLLRGLYESVADDIVETEARSFALAAAAPDLVDALSRYLRLARSPVAARVLGPAVLRELHFHLLMSPVGGMLRALLRHDSRASQIARAIAVLRRDFRLSLSVPALARTAGMSASAFHLSFKAITATTPLRYQKELRLLEARRLLLREGQPVASVAYAVGYESPTQFSREYARKFGLAPSRERGRRA